MQNIRILDSVRELDQKIFEMIFISVTGPVVFDKDTHIEAWLLL